MTDAERWRVVAQRAGRLMNDWIQKYPGIIMMFPGLKLIVGYLHEASLTKIERALDELEKKP